MDYQLGPGPLQVDQNTIDEKIKGDIGIVENGDVATHTIPNGYYVIWKGDLYVAKTNISSGTTLSAESNGNLTAKSNGLGGEVAELNGKVGNVGSTDLQSQVTALNSNKVNTSDIVNALNNTSTNKPLSAAQGKSLNDKIISLTKKVVVAPSGTASLGFTPSFVIAFWYHGSDACYPVCMVDNNGTMTVFTKGGANAGTVKFNGSTVYNNTNVYIIFVAFSDY